MKQVTYKTEVPKKNNNTIIHISALEATRMNKEYIIPANRSEKYSKLDKLKRKEEQKIKKELQEYKKYNL